MKTADARRLYERLRIPAPQDIAAPAQEHIRGTRRKVVQGICFRSTLEADCYQLLRLWQDAGLIQGLELQPKFVLQVAFRSPGIKRQIQAITYRADFSFTAVKHSRWMIGERVVIEAKGWKTEPFKLRRKMFLNKYPGLNYEIWTREVLRGINV